MTFLLRGLFGFASLLVVARASAQSLLPAEPTPLISLSDLRTGANWHLAGGLAGDPRTDKVLTPAPGTGVLVNAPTKDAHEHLLTSWTHGDIDLDLDFLIAAGANSGVYLQGRYEVQLFDSWGVQKPTASDCGAIYQRWDASRGQGKEGFEGFAPRANASRAPGLWQHLHIEFEAPRFDAAGKKIKNARFRKVVLNGFTVQEDVEVTGPTRSSAFEDEKPLGPLMIQGDHGSVAIRSITSKRYDSQTRLKVENLAYKHFAGAFKKVGEYDADQPTSSGTPAKFATSAVPTTGRFALVFTGSLIVPRDGAYAFTADSYSSIRLIVDDQVVIRPFERGSEPGKISLKAGAHSFRLDQVHNFPGRPFLDVMVEGPGLASQSIMANDPRPASDVKPERVYIEPIDNRVRMQRGFVPYMPKKRLYATSVGTPAGVHFAYDMEAGSILRVWRGAWLDMSEMWVGRGENQYAKPNGPALTLSSKPTVALIESPRTSGWPDQLDALSSSQGYELEADGLPVFLSTLSKLNIRDRIAPVNDGRGLQRTLTFTGTTSSWESVVLLAESSQITPQPNGGWVIGDREYYIDYPKDAAHQPLVQTRGERQQLVVRLSKSNLADPLSYTLVW